MYSLIKKSVKMWLDVNKLSFNIDKTKYVIFKSPQHCLSVTTNIKIENLPFKNTRCIKFLGILSGENLSWRYHLAESSKNELEPVVYSSK